MQVKVRKNTRGYRRAARNALIAAAILGAAYAGTTHIASAIEQQRYALIEGVAFDLVGDPAFQYIDGWAVVDGHVIGDQFYHRSDFWVGDTPYTPVGDTAFPVLNREHHKLLFRGNSARPMFLAPGFGDYCTYTPDGRRLYHTRMRKAHDVLGKTGSEYGIQTGVIAVAVATNTTTATKTQYLGCLTYDITGTTLGTGAYEQHEFHFAQTTFQAAQEDWSCTDPRPGAQNGAYISGRDGDWYGSLYMCPMWASGNHGTTGYGEDWGGNTDTATTSNTSVAAFAGTTVYVTGSGAGTNSGADLANAYDADDFTTAHSSTSNLLVLIEDGETLAPTSLTTMTGDNIGFYPCDSNGDMLLTGTYTENADSASWVRTHAGCENWTEWGKYKQKTGGGHTVIVQAGGCVTDGLYGNCGIDNSLGRAKSFIEASATAANNRYMILNADCDGADNYPGAFGQVEIAVFGGTFTNANGDSERIFRINNNGSMNSIGVFIGLDCDAGYKDCIRLHETRYSYVYRCKLVCSGTASGINGVWINETGAANGDNRAVRVTHNYHSITTTGGGSAILWQTGTADSNQTGFFGWNVVDQDNTSSRGIDIDNACYQATVIGNTIVSAAQVQILRVIPTQNCYVYGNALKYDGAAGSSMKFLAVSNPAGTLEVENNVGAQGNDTNTTPWSHDSTDYNLTNFNAITGIADNTEATISVDGDFVTDTGDYTPPAGRDYYGTDIGGASNQIGAVEGSGPTPPTISTSTPANAATGVLNTVTSYATVWSEDIAYGTVDGTIAGGGLPANIEQDDWVITAMNEDNATMTIDLSATTAGSTQTVTLAAGSFRSKSTGLYNEEIVRTFTMLDSSAPTFAIRDASRIDRIRMR